MCNLLTIVSKPQNCIHDKQASFYQGIGIKLMNKLIMAVKMFIKRENIL